MKSRGFTLLELLVAITVLSVVSTITWRGLDSLVTTRERLEPDADDVRALLTAFGQMERDLAQVTNPQFLGLKASPVNVSIADGAMMLQLARIGPRPRSGCPSRTGSRYRCCSIRPPAASSTSMARRTTCTALS